MSNSKREEAIRRAFAGVANGQPEALLDLLDDEVRWTILGSAPFSGTYNGKSDLIERLLMPLSEILDGHLRIEIDSIIESADFATVQARGFSKTRDGREYNNTYCYVYRFQEGKIIEVKEYLDTEILRQAFA